LELFSDVFIKARKS